MGARPLKWTGATAVALLALAAAPAQAAQEKCTVSAFTMPVTMEGTRASVPVSVNGVKTDFWLDSGAWFSIMPQAKADELHLKLERAPGYLRMYGIGGSFTPMVVHIKDFAVVGTALHDVDFLVGGTDAGNGLIGRNLLAAFDTEFDLPHGEVKLVQATGCRDANMAYWAKDKPFFTVKLLSNGEGGAIHNFALPIALNGKEVRAEIDSGALTLVTRRAAERAGIDLKGPGVEPVSGIGGFGRQFKQGWIVPFKSIDIGDEKILNAKVTVIDGDISPGSDGPDMLLGIGFLLSHHLYVSRDQHLIFFTYSGGSPFLTGTSGTRDGPPAAIPASAIPAGMQLVHPVEGSSQPHAAEDFARRGAVRLARRDTAGAIDDFSQAIRLAPENAAYYKQRAMARLAADDKSGAIEDLDQSIERAPKDAEARLSRAELRHSLHDDQGALADATAAQGLLAPQSLEFTALADLYDELGRAKDAIPLYEGVIATHPDDSRLGFLLNGRCWSRALANVELDDALDDCNRALKLTGKSPMVLDSRALVEFRRKDYAAALADYEAVLKRDPKTAWSLYMRGVTSSALGQAAKGEADRKAATALDADVERRAAQYGIVP
ncbi:MAG TPA: aspartyl protease family protein [Croceibacterium sp.]|jgi:tetratricopeptide (TPR) repeat protein/predicted aspartyl protease